LISAASRSSNLCYIAALDGKGRAQLPAHEVRELVWNVQNHPNPCNRSDSIQTLFKAITSTRSIDDKQISEAFGASLRPFIEFVITNALSNDLGSDKFLASSASHFAVLRHLMVSASSRCLQRWRIHCIVAESSRRRNHCIRAGRAEAFA
jgi:hypothetical protein